MENLSKRAAASRANGAKSRGPRTSAGKKRSSLNAIRHGYLSKCVVLNSENKDIFKAHHEHYIKTFNPTDGVEDDLVEEMVSASWRLGRLVDIETALFHKALVKQPGLAGAFSELATNNEFALVHRYQSSIHRMFQRSFKNLILLRQFKAQEGNEPEEEIPNEPRAGETNLDPSPNEPESDLPNEPSSASEPIESATSTEDAALPNEPRPGPTPVQNATGPNEPRIRKPDHIPPGTRRSVHQIIAQMRWENQQ